MKLYVLLRTGVEIKCVAGIFETKTKANAAESKLLETEPDSHHYYQTVERELDKVHCEVIREQNMERLSMNS